MNTEHLERLRENWNSLGLKRQAIVGGVFFASLLGILALTRLATQTDYALLYSGLEPAAAGEVVAALEQRGVPHQVKPSGIFVDASQRDRLRIALASEGMPTSGTAGYELLDSLSGFGTTSKMFDATVKRAKEGELARTIAASSAIKTARVHISAPTSRGLRELTPGSASVFVTPLRATLTAPQVEALQFLVASAVGGISPESVSIIDSVSGRLLSAGQEGPSANTDLELSDALRARVERLLEARVGLGNAIVEVNVESGLDRERIIERKFDPDSRVAISTETTENNTNSSQASRGPVTIASNLPDGDAASSGEDSLSETETRERVNYEVSETTREIDKVPGTIRRLSVAVLVNDFETTDESGAAQFEPRTAEELASMEALVKSAVGFDEARGDIVTLRSMRMPTSEIGDVEPNEALLSKLGVNATPLLRTAILGIAAVLLGVLVAKPILLASLRKPPEVSPAERGLPHPNSASLQLDSTQAPPQSQAAAARPQQFALDGEVAGPGVPLPEPTAAALDRLPNKADAVSRLREQMKLRKADSVAVLQNWVEDAREIR